MTSYEIVVIGTGPAGHHAAIQAAKLGRSVAIIERLRCVGGVCINTGTIPSKTLREGVLYLSGFQQRGLYGHSYRVKADHHHPGPHVPLPSRDRQGERRLPEPVHP
jgi:NAD(P) transhydrogenase